MDTLPGRLAAARIACAGLFWGGILLGSSPPADAQWGTPSSITDEEAIQYVHILSSAFRQCDAEWFAGQFLPSARIVLIYADGQEGSFSPSEYAQDYFPRYCRPYDFIDIKWDRRHFQISPMGAVTSVRWSIMWGKRLHMTAGDEEARMRFDNWTDLVKDGQRIRIANAGWQAHELVPGAAQEFEAIGQGDLLFYRLSRFVGGVLEWPSEVYGTLKERLRRRHSDTRVTRHDGDDRAIP